MHTAVLLPQASSLSQLEAMRCWVSTGNMFQELPASREPALVCYRGAVAVYNLLGGQPRVAQLLCGDELTQHLAAACHAHVRCAAAAWAEVIRTHSEAPATDTPEPSNSMQSAMTLFAGAAELVKFAPDLVCDGHRTA